MHSFIVLQCTVLLYSSINTAVMQHCIVPCYTVVVLVLVLMLIGLG